MAILNRVMRLFKADLHGVMDQLEDKELLLKQYLREMETSLQEKEHQLNQITKREEIIRRDLELRGEEIDRIDNDVTLSLRKEKDDIAKLLIRKQLGQKGICDQLRQQLRSLKDKQQQLGRLLGEQRLQYDGLKVKATAFYSREQEHVFDTAHAISGDSPICPVTDEKEIELELLRRKETLQLGGDA